MVGARMGAGGSRRRVNYIDRKMRLQCGGGGKDGGGAVE